MDLIGGPFAVIESDPGVFTSLVRKLGVEKLSLIELYDIEPWATDHLQPHGLILCFHWRKDVHRPAEFENPEQVWFANQLSDDACASHAILNVLLNCPSVELGQELKHFKSETREMSPVMKGLAVTNSSFIRDAHNSLARQADLRGSLNTIASTTLDAQKAKEKEAKTQQQARKKTSKVKSPAKSKAKNKAIDALETNGSSEEEETYHFIGYVPVLGKVWELDGLKPGPLEVGELPSEQSTEGWLNVARPALRMKMAKYGAANIRFSLLAIVDGTFEKAHDQWWYWVRDVISLEKRLNQTDDSWKSKVDSELLATVEHATTLPDAPGHNLIEAGARRNERDREIMDLPVEGLLTQWENAVRQVIRTKVDVEDEVQRAAIAYTDHIKRTHDYEPFLVEFIKSLHTDGILDALLDDRKATKMMKNNEGKAQPKTIYQDDEEDGIDEVDLLGVADDGDDDWKPTTSRRK